MTHTTQFDLPSSLSVELHDEIAVLCLSRPEKRNAINNEMIHGIDRFFGALPAAIRAVVIHGKGVHFCAGLDLSSITDATAPLGSLVRARGIASSIESNPGMYRLLPCCTAL